MAVPVRWAKKPDILMGRVSVCLSPFISFLSEEVLAAEGINISLFLTKKFIFFKNLAPRAAGRVA